MSFITKKMQEYEDGTFRLVRENEDGSGLFIYKGESIILKRCKRGYWKDPATGECVPKEQLRGTEQPKAVEPKAEVPKQEQSASNKEKPKQKRIKITSEEAVSIFEEGFKQVGNGAIYTTDIKIDEEYPKGTPIILSTKDDNYYIYNYKDKKWEKSPFKNNTQLMAHSTKTSIDTLSGGKYEY